MALSLTDPSRAENFGLYAHVAGFVTELEDENGRTGWAPMAWRRMSLLDRVLSLVAADYLTRPSDYVNELFVCPIGDSVSFDAEARHGGACGVCRRVSKIVRSHGEAAGGGAHAA